MVGSLLREGSRQSPDPASNGCVIGRDTLFWGAVLRREVLQRRVWSPAASLRIPRLPQDARQPGGGQGVRARSGPRVLHRLRADPTAQDRRGRLCGNSWPPTTTRRKTIEPTPCAISMPGTTRSTCAPATAVPRARGARATVVSRLLAWDGRSPVRYCTAVIDRQSSPSDRRSERHDEDSASPAAER